MTQRRSARSVRPRGRPSGNETPASSDEVLAAALHAFATHGYQGVSVRTLNRELGVSHNLLNQRFGTKSAIWFAAVDWGFGDLMQQLIASGAEYDDPLDRLRAFIRTFVSFSARHPDLLRLVNIEGSVKSERLDYIISTFVLPTMARMQPTYAELAEKGLVRDVPPQTIYFLITSGGGAMFSSDAMTRAIFTDEVFTEQQMDEHANAVAELIIRGLLVDKVEEAPTVTM